MTLALPASPDAEAATISRLLVDPAQLPVLADKLHPEDFYTPEFRVAYAAMQKLSAEHRTVDLVSLGEAGKGINRMLADLTPAHKAPLDEYALILRRDSFRRRMIGALDSLTRKAYEVDDQQQLLSELQAAVTGIAAGMQETTLISMQQALENYEGVREHRAQHGSGLTYGIAPLDHLIQPASGGDMVVVAARPSVGKTALAENIADHWANESEHPVLFASIEMSVSQLLDRAVSRNAGIEAQRVVRGLLTDEEERLARASIESRRAVNIWYLDDAFATTASVRAGAAKVRMLAGGLTAIVIDYLQLLKDPGDSEVQRVTRISRQVKAIAREFAVPVLVLSQLNRAVMGRDDPHPKLHDLRESGAIEQDADIVIGLTRELGSIDMDLDVLKNRNGAVGRVELAFDPSRVSFQEAA